MTGKLSYSVPKKLDVTMTSKQVYETSSMRDYNGSQGTPADNARPGTSNFYSQTETGPTNYEKEYEWKYVEGEDRGRPGSSSGQRKNNPHPLETFMVWKFPQNRDRNEILKGKQTELLQEICNDKIRSTYQVDFLGVNLGERLPLVPPSNVLKGLKDEESFYTFNKKPTFTLNTTARVDYQNQMSTDCCKKINTTQPFASGKKTDAAVGVVPTERQSQPVTYGMYDTSYSNDFGILNNQDSVPNTEPDLSEYLQNMSVKEKKTIGNMLHAITEKQDGACQRISKWDGPSWK